MYYEPDFLEVPAGSTVTFILENGDDPSHPIGFEPEVRFDISGVGRDLHLTYTYNDPGDYNFFCTIHGNSGLLRVLGAHDAM
jgi:plastocyanin